MDIDNIANGFLELASEQRLNILLKLESERITITEMAKQLGATVPEVHRNFARLQKAGLIQKNSDGNHELTSFGKFLCVQIPSFNFIIKNRGYFEKHDFADIPEKFLLRLAQFDSVSVIKGFVKVLEQWKEMHQNAKKYIYNILFEVPYSPDIIEIISDKLSKGIMIKSIFAEDAIIPKDRKKLYEKHDFKKFIQNNTLERKMVKKVTVVVLLNESESCIILPDKNGEINMSEMIHSKNPKFHEWCEDYFWYCWKDATAFQELKIKN